MIAAELMEKAKKIEAVVIKKEEPSQTPSPPPAPQISQSSPQTPSPPRISSTTNNNNRADDEFDIPTISELTTSASSQKLHTKELSQLQELQIRINETKKKLQSSKSNEEQRKSLSPVKLSSSISSRLGVKPNENSKPANIIKLSAIRKAENEFSSSSLRKFVEKQKEDNDRRESRRNANIRSDHRSNRNRRSRSNSRGYQRSKRFNSRSRSPIERR